MPSHDRPTDAQLQQMGIICVETMLPPSPSMLLAGSRALAAAVLKAKGSNTLLEEVFAAMVLEGLQDLERLGATVGAGPVTRQRRGGERAAAEPALLAEPSSPLLCSCKVATEECLRLPNCQLMGQALGSGATVQVDEANAPELIAASNGILRYANSLPAAPASAGLLSPAASERKVLDCTAPIYPACDCSSPCGYCKWRLQQKKQTTEAPAPLAKQSPTATTAEARVAEGGKGATAPPKPPGIQQSNPGHFESLRAYLQKKLPRTQKKEDPQ